MSDSITHMERTKQCTKCGRTFPLSEFGKHRLSPDSHAYQCKDCARKRAKIYRLTAKGIYTALKGRAVWRQKNNVLNPKPFKISKKEFVDWYNSQERRCAYCEIPEEKLYLIRDDFDKRIRRLEVDCKNNELGYIKDNLVLACHPCNFFKSCLFSFDEMREIGQKYVKPRWQKRIAKVRKNEES